MTDLLVGYAGPFFMFKKLNALSKKRKRLIPLPVPDVKLVAVHLYPQKIQMPFRILHGLKPLCVLPTKPDKTCALPNHIPVLRTYQKTPALHVPERSSANVAFLAGIDPSFHAIFLPAGGCNILPRRGQDLFIHVHQI
jgi:hypothetical protein